MRAWRISFAQNEPAIVKEWVEFARTRSPASDKMTKLALEDHIVDILGFVADDLEFAQTPREPFDKSRGNGAEDGPFSQSAAELHGALRPTDGFDIDQMVRNTGRFERVSSSNGWRTIRASPTSILRI